MSVAMSYVPQAILKVFGVATVDSSAIHEALQLQSSDFEDAVTASAARQGQCDYIVTAIRKDFGDPPSAR